MTEFTITLPEDLACKAGEAGLLNSDGIECLLRDALRRQAGRQLIEFLRSSPAADLPPITEEEIRAEIDAVRAERCAKHDAPGAGASTPKGVTS